MSRPFMEFVHPDDVERRARRAAGAGRPARTSSDSRAASSAPTARYAGSSGTRAPCRTWAWCTASRGDVTERTALAEEQAALRRVATLVARESSPDEVFAAVVEERGAALGVTSTAMLRYEDDGTATPVASWGELAARPRSVSSIPIGRGQHLLAGVQRPHGPRASTTTRTRTARSGHVQGAGRPRRPSARRSSSTGGSGARCSPSRPSRCRRTRSPGWSSSPSWSPPRSRTSTPASALTASRARIVAAADEERRRVARDLHDGAQQRLVHTVITLKLAQQALERDADDASSLVSEALEHAQRANHELRELAHGILPAALTAGGLAAGVEALASRMPVPVAGRDLRRPPARRRSRRPRTSSSPRR